MHNAQGMPKMKYFNNAPSQLIFKKIHESKEFELLKNDLHVLGTQQTKNFLWAHYKNQIIVTIAG